MAKDIRRIASKVRQETRINLRLMGEIDVKEVMQVTGLGPVEAVRAQQREFSECIVWPRGDERLTDELAKAFAGHGLMATKGGRFLTIHGSKVSKGRAVARLLESYSGASGAVGDGPNDVSMLSEVGFPYLVRGKGNRPATIESSRLTIINEYGPAGFVLAAEDFLVRTGS